LGGIDAANDVGRGTGLKTLVYRKFSYVGLTVERVNGSSSFRTLIAFTKLSNAVRAPLKPLGTPEARYLLEIDSGSRRTESKEDCQVEVRLPRGQSGA
jgi:hypothetical protein